MFPLGVNKEAVNRIPIGSTKLSQRRLARFRLILGGGQYDTLMRRAKTRSVSLLGAFFRFHPKPFS